MSPFDELNQQIHRLFNGKLRATPVNELDLSLWLLQTIETQDFSPAQVDEIWSNMPYWAFAWSSGRALARYLIQNPELVKGKSIADFGAGSGIVALAALKAGAQSAVVVDIDPNALVACQENGLLNGFELQTAHSLDEITAIDIIVVGDVLYDPRNHGLAEVLFTQDKKVIWAESQAQTKLSQYGPVASMNSETLPNLGGFDEHKQIHIYHHGL